MTEIVRLALEEDIGTGDVTSIACVPETRMAAGRFLAREPLILAGVGLLWEIYQLRGGVDELNILKQDGDRCIDGEVIATVRGRARTLLACERVALNFLQRLSGVATAAASSPLPSRAPAAASSIPARPPPACALWKRPRRPPAASPTTAWASTTPS